MQDAEALVLAEAGQALRLERALDAARAVDAVERADGAGEIAVAHQRHDDVGVVAPLGPSRYRDCGCARGCRRPPRRPARCGPGVARLSMKTRTGPSYLRMRSTPPATWNSAPNVTLKKPSMISASVKVLRSAARRRGDLGILGGGDGAGDRHAAASATSRPIERCGAPRPALRSANARRKPSNVMIRALMPPRSGHHGG